MPVRSSAIGNENNGHVCFCLSLSDYRAATAQRLIVRMGGEDDGWTDEIFFPELGRSTFEEPPVNTEDAGSEVWKGACLQMYTLLSWGT